MSLLDAPRPGREDAPRPAVSSATVAPWTVLFGPWSVGAGLAVVAVAVLGTVWLGPEAIGVDLCWFRRLSGGLPCPGCGLTRSLVALVQGELARSARLHPFGGVLMIWALAAASSPWWPRALRRTIAAGLERREAAFDRGYEIFVAAFVGFGLLRLLATILRTQL